jgi:hypothetical protein
LAILHYLHWLKKLIKLNLKKKTILVIFNNILSAGARWKTIMQCKCNARVNRMNTLKHCTCSPEFHLVHPALGTLHCLKGFACKRLTLLIIVINNVRQRRWNLENIRNILFDTSWR